MVREMENNSDQERDGKDDKDGENKNKNKNIESLLDGVENPIIISSKDSNEKSSLNTTTSADFIKKKRNFGENIGKILTSDKIVSLYSYS